MEDRFEGIFVMEVSRERRGETEEKVVGEGDGGVEVGQLRSASASHSIETRAVKKKMFGGAVDGLTVVAARRRTFVVLVEFGEGESDVET